MKLAYHRLAARRKENLPLISKDSEWRNWLLQSWSLHGLGSFEY